MSRCQLGCVFIISPDVIASVGNTYKPTVTTNVRLWKLILSSSLRNWTSSMISSSDHFRVQRFFANGRSWATNIAGKFEVGALVTKFYW